jgi:hypothetical protein
VIGTIRHEYFDHLPFWNSLDLERKLREFKDYSGRTHAALSGYSPAKFGLKANEAFVNINHYGWRQYLSQIIPFADSCVTTNSQCTP